MVRVMERHFVETKECYFPAALCVFGGENWAVGKETSCSHWRRLEMVNKYTCKHYVHYHQPPLHIVLVDRR